MSGELPLISIIVPVYNVEKYLPECIESICGQVNINKEIVLVDDGSTDGSGIICDQYAEKCADIVVVHKENGGLASARNAGLDVIHGQFVGFVDSDDYIASDMYETLYKAMQQTNSEIGCCNWVRCHKNADGSNQMEATSGKILKETVLDSKEALRSLFLDTGLTYSACDKLFQSKLFEQIRFPKENLPSEDIPCIYSIIKQVSQIVHIGRNKYYYRVVQESITKQVFQPKNISTFRYMQGIQDDVIVNCPELIDEIDYAVIQSAASSYARLIADKVTKQCEEEKRVLETYLRQHMGQLIKNPFFSIGARLANISMALHSYSLFLIIKSGL